MADTGKRFRFTPVGGFRRQDVITYIEALMKEHHEEVDAYRSGNELLRRERDEARERILALQVQADELMSKSKHIPSMQSDMDSLKTRVNQLAAEKNRMGETLQKMEGAREGDRTAMSRLQFLLSERESRLVSLQIQYDEFVAAHADAEELVKKAAERAHSIEEEALENARRSQELITRLWLDTKTRYAVLCKAADEASAVAVRELEKARELLLGAGQVFGGVNSRLNNLPLAEPHAARSEEPAAAPLSGETPSLRDMLAQQKLTQSVKSRVQPVDAGAGAGAGADAEIVVDIGVGAGIDANLGAYDVPEPEPGPGPGPGLGPTVELEPDISPDPEE